MPTPARLATRRLALRPHAPADLAAVHRLWTTPEVRRFLFDGRRLDRAEVQTLLAESEANFAARGFGIWLAFRADDPALAGFAGLLAGPDEAVPRLVYGVRAALCGTGLATEAARAVLDHAFGRLCLARVAADVDEPNVGSVRVLEKLGMRRVRRDLVEGRPLLTFECEAPR